MGIANAISGKCNELLPFTFNVQMTIISEPDERIDEQLNLALNEISKLFG
jgi:hypothetical protein